MSNTIGLVLLEDEPFDETINKWLAWVTVMIIFVIIIIWFSKYFETHYCDFRKYPNKYDIQTPNRDRKY
jgi:hypothetical protein